MSYEEVLRLNARVTMQQMLQREDFKERIAKGQEVRLHEIQYPIMQGWDSVEVRSDVEIGGTDQLFNILVGRDLQKEEGQPQQVVMLMPLLEGLDGTKKMSKSSHNYVGVNEAPNEMFGKLMSISDELMDRYYLLLLGSARDASLHPMEAKKELARLLVSRYHSDEGAKAAIEFWNLRHSKGDVSVGAVDYRPSGDQSSVAQIVQSAFLEVFDLQKSLGEVKKQFIIPGAVQLDGVKLTDPAGTFEAQSGQILRLSKKHSVKIV